MNEQLAMSSMLVLSREVIKVLGVVKDGTGDGFWVFRLLPSSCDVQVAGENVNRDDLDESVDSPESKSGGESPCVGNANWSWSFCSVKSSNWRDVSLVQDVSLGN